MASATVQQAEAAAADPDGGASRLSQEDELLAEEDVFNEDVMDHVVEALTEVAPPELDGQFLHNLYDGVMHLIAAERGRRQFGPEFAGRLGDVLARYGGQSTDPHGMHLANDIASLRATKRTGT